MCVSLQICNFDQCYLKNYCVIIKHITIPMGETITSNGNCEDEISNIIEIAIGTLNYMLQTVTARHIRMKTRKIIMKAYV